MLCMLGSDGKRARHRGNGKKARQREKERRCLPHRFKKVRIEEEESLFYGKQKSKTSPEKQDKFFSFGFPLTNLFSVDSHFLTLPNTGKHYRF